MIPLIGKKFFDALLRHTLENNKYLVDFQPPKGGLPKEINLSGGKSILINEQYDMASGFSEGMRLEALSSKMEFVSNYKSQYPDSIRVNTGRYLERNWGIIEYYNSEYSIRPTSNQSMILILRKGGTFFLLTRRRDQEKLISGDQIIIGQSHFEYISLPKLVLVEQGTNVVVCEDIEDGEEWHLKPHENNKIKAGIFYYSDKKFYVSNTNENIGRPDSGGFSATLHPGDKIKINDSNKYYVSYSLENL